MPYTLTDMAADAIGLLDHLGIDRAHIVGASMGGMIVQTMAIEHPDRVRTLTSIMSMTGEPEYATMPEPGRHGGLDLAAADRSRRRQKIGRAKDSAVFCSKRYFDLALAEEHSASTIDVNPRPPVTTGYSRCRRCRCRDLEGKDPCAGDELRRSRDPAASPQRRRDGGMTRWCCHRLQRSRRAGPDA